MPARLSLYTLLLFLCFALNVAASPAPDTTHRLPRGHHQRPPGKRYPFHLAESSLRCGTTSTSVYSEKLSGASGNNYTKDLAIKTRNLANVERYTSTVINLDGLKNSVSLKITVN